MTIEVQLPNPKVIWHVDRNKELLESVKQGISSEIPGLIVQTFDEPEDAYKALGQIKPDQIPFQVITDRVGFTELSNGSSFCQRIHQLFPLTMTVLYSRAAFDSPKGLQSSRAVDLLIRKNNLSKLLEVVYAWQQQSGQPEVQDIRNRILSLHTSSTKDDEGKLSQLIFSYKTLLMRDKSFHELVKNWEPYCPRVAETHAKAIDQISYKQRNSFSKKLPCLLYGMGSVVDIMPTPSEIEIENNVLSFNSLMREAWTVVGNSLGQQAKSAFEHRDNANQGHRLDDKFEN